MKRSGQRGFSRYERNGIILLCALIIASIVSQRYILRYFITNPAQLTAADRSRLEQLQQQIRDASVNTNYSDNNDRYSSTNKYEHPQTGSYQSKKYEDFKIEVNSASAAEFEKLYGIGKVLSVRIVTFRDKLGGFHSLQQIKDVYGIEDSIFQKFKKNLTIKPAKIRKININSATYEELTACPYFFTTLAKQVIGYRTKVKPFESPEDVKNLYYIRDHPETFDKIAVYISIN
jgi:competence ComEA-like helix-hairpin-helix protein